MKRRLAYRTFALLLSAALLGAEIVDRIAVSVGNRVITSSDIDREIRVTAFIDGKPADFSPAGRRKAADRMVEQTLIRKELETSRYSAVSPSDIEPILRKIRRERFPTEADFRAGLAAAGITSEDLSAELLWVNRVSSFVGERFRAGVQITEQEVSDYFEKVMRPLAQAANPGQPVSLSVYRAQIEDTLAEPRVLAAMDEWLKEARKRADIVYHEEAFR